MAIRRRTIVGIVGFLIVLVAAVLATRRGSGGVEVDEAPVAKKASFRSFVTASGQVVAQRYADIGSSVMGKLVDLRVKEGETVTAGQVLARIDAVQAAAGASAAASRVKAAEADARAAAEQLAAARADLEAARAREAEAQQTFTRSQDLRRDGLVPAADLDRAKANADAAAAQVSAAQAIIRRLTQALESAARRQAEAMADSTRARDVLDKTDIVSPIDGIVTRLPVQQGEMVVIGIQNQPGTTLMTISDLSAIDAEVKVAEADVLRVQVGQPATVTLEALPGVTFPGRVVEVGASALPVTGSGAAAREFRVKVRLDQPAASLRPGLTCDTEILTAERQGVLAVPLQAVVVRPSTTGEDQTGVFVLDGRNVRFQPVTTGLIGGLDIEVNGISEGAPVVVGPFQALRDLQSGQAVRVRTRQ
ncbi:MAG: efflux RND transporter periplasmic adaptor subunit [Vicinamibacterales bacterium]|nr:efflux RND transporter periplasmic adaptor subunit [Vicinamibacterales bacterium]